MARAGGWLRGRVGVRVASALSAALVVGVALVVAGGALVFLVGQSLRGTVEDTTEQRALQIVERIEDNYQRDAKENSVQAIDLLAAKTDLAQVVIDYAAEKSNDEVVEVSTDAVATTPDGKPVRISRLMPADDELVVVPDALVPRADGSWVPAVLVAAGGTTEKRNVVVLLAMPLDGVAAATDTVLFYLTFGVPILIVVAGLTTYLFAGRALRPVEAIRAQVAEMSEKDLAQRVPVPPARDEVGRLAETMNAMIGRLEDAQGVQRRFVADASHELRSPLATIATGLELLQRSSIDQATVGALRREADRLNQLVDALLLLARADERGLQPRREEVDLDEVAEAERGRPAERAVAAEVHAEPVRVIGDRGQLARVLRNLVDNARRHARSRVLVTVVRDGDSAVIEVSDDGPGVPETERGRVFERFVRLDHARARHDGGSGLGLAIVAEVVAAHGGTVEVTDAPGGGALFRVRLPATARAEVPVIDEPAPSVPEAEPEASGTTGRLPVITAHRLSHPVRDAEARRDPETAPWGIPAVADGGGLDTLPQGFPVTAPPQQRPLPQRPLAQGPLPPHPGRADERRGQPGSIIR